MYREGNDQYRYHVRTYGHPSEFGYKDVVQLWKAEWFDPEALMDRFVAAGARHFVAQTVHHDNFFNYDSALNPWNSTKAGPGKDILALWKAAADERGLPFGITEHLDAAFSWMAVNKGSGKHGQFAGVPYDGSIRRTGICASTTAATCLQTSWFRIRGTATIRAFTGTG